MNLAKMRELFKDHSSGLADDLGDSDIDVYLNLMYQFVIPAEVDGSLTERVWEWEASDSSSSLAIPSWIVSMNEPKAWIFKIGSTIPVRLDVSYDFAVFVRRWPSRNDVDIRGLPTDVLVHGDSVYFNQVPDQSYTGAFVCRGGPEDPIDGGGLPNEILVQAVVAGAAWSYLLAKEDSMGAAREGGIYDIYKQLLHTQSNSRFKARRAARSF